MKTIHSLKISLVAAAFSCATIAQAATIIWTNTVSGGWNTAANWNPNQVPGTNDTAVITLTNAGVVVSLNGATGAGGIILGTNAGGPVTLSLAGQTLTLNGPLTVNSSGSFAADSGTLFGYTNAVLSGTIGWTGGTWGGTLSLASGSTLNITAGANHFIGGCLFTNTGMVNWSGATLYAGGGAVFYNFGLWNAQDDQQLNNYSGSTTVFNNYGTFRKSGGAGEFAGSTYFAGGVSFNQLAGVIDVQNGTNGLQLVLAGGGNFTGGYITTNQFGLTVLNSGNFSLNGTVTGTNTWADTGTFVGTTVISGGLTWVGGTWNGTVITVTSNSVLNINSANNHFIGGCLFTNYGTVNWSGGYLYAGGGAVFYNFGLWNAQDDQQLNNYSSGTTTFNNYGIFRKSGGAGEFANSTIITSGVMFNQLAGVIDVQNGTNGLQLSLQGGGNFTGGYITTNVSGLTTFASAANLNLNGTLTGTNTWLTGGVLAGANIINGFLTWVGGSFNSAASVTIAPNATLLVVGGTGNNDMDATVVTNLGTVTWTSGTIRGGYGAAVYNYGLWNCQSDQTFNNAYGGTGGTTFNNYGTLRKSGGGPEFTNATYFANGVVFNQLAGAIDVQNSTNGLQLGLQGGGSFTGGYVTTNQFGLLTLSGVNYTLNGTITGTNTWETYGGGLIGTNVITGGLTWLGGNWNAAQYVTIATNSTLLVAGTTLYGNNGLNDLEATVVTNYGTVTWTSGTLRGGYGTTIDNYNLWDCQSDQTLNNAYGGTGGTTFNNFATLRKSGGGPEFTNATYFASGVLFNQLAGVLDVQNSTNGLQLDFQGGGNFTGGYITTNQFGLTVLNGGNFTLNGTVTGTNTWDNAGYLVNTNVIQGGLTWISGLWNYAQLVTVAANSTLVLAGGGNNLDMESTVLTNNGTVAWSSGTLRGGFGTAIFNKGVWNAQSDQVFNNAYGGTGGTVFNNLGAFIKTAGTNNGAGSQFQSGVSFNNSGRLDAQAGVISLQGAYGLATGTLNFGINSLTNYGEISLAGAAPLVGTVSANLNNGFQPISGNSFTNLYYGSFTGIFTNATLPFADAWTTNYYSTNFVLTVLNARPILTSLATNTFAVSELTTLNVTNKATDADIPPQTLTYSLVAGTNGMTVNPATGIFAWTPQQTNSPTTNTIAVAVTDNGTPPLSATNIFTVVVQEVNVPPSLPTISTQTVNELTVLTVTDTATNANIHSTNSGYALVNPPSGMVISSSGVISWTPAQTQSPATNTITVVVTNSNPFDLTNPKLTATNIFTVIVKEVNVAPVLPTVVTQIVNELTLLTVTNTATNANIHAAITGYRLVSPPSNMVVSTGGVITWTPAQAQSPGTNLITTIVTNTDAFDLVNPYLTTTNTFTVIVKEVNQAPVLGIIGTQTATLLQLFTLNNSAAEPNIHSTNAGYLLVSPPAGASISSNGVVSWTPVPSQTLTTNTLTTIVTNNNPYDLATPHLSATNSFSVVVLPNLVRTNITMTNFGGTNLNLTWPLDHTGWHLQVQTNTLTKGLGTNWTVIAGSSATNSVNVPLAKTNAAVFYWMIYP